MRVGIVFLFALFGFLGFVGASHGGPFLVCDPQAGVTHYKLTGPSWVPTQVPAQPDGSIRMDVGQAAVGQTSLTIAACRVGTGGWEECSEFVPFSFTRPSRPVPPVNIRLSQ